MDTSSLFFTLTRCCVQGRGIGHVLKMEDEVFSSQAGHSARKKLPTGAFKEVNRYLHRGPHKPRVFAVDGSNVHVHPSFTKAGFKTRTNDKPVSRPAKRPLVMLSSMVDVRTKACIDFELTKHFNERKAAISMLRSVRKGDTLLFDTAAAKQGFCPNSCCVRILYPVFLLPWGGVSLSTSKACVLLFQFLLHFYSSISTCSWVINTMCQGVRPLSHEVKG